MTNIKIPQIFNANTEDGEDLITQVEELLFKLKKDAWEDPIFINGVPYTIRCGKPPNTNMLHFMNEEQAKKWDDINVYMRPFAQPKGVYAVHRSIWLRNKETRRDCAKQMCHLWHHRVTYDTFQD